MSDLPAATTSARLVRKQCQLLRQRIRDNVKIALREDWKSLHTWYKPQKVHNPDDSAMVSLLQQQEAVKDKIETAKKPSTDPIKKHLIINALRSEFPQLAAQLPEPEAAQPSPLKMRPIPPLGAYNLQSAANRESEDAPNARLPSPKNISTTKPAEPQAAKDVKKHGLGVTSSQSSAKKIKIEDAIQLNDTDDDMDHSDGDDADFNSQQERRKRVVSRGERKRIRGEDFAAKLKTAVTEEQLLRQHVELKQKFRFDEIQIFKKIAHIHGDGAKEFRLVEEELEIKHQREREKARRKYEGMVSKSD